jgi:hypothetical protein
MKLKTDYRISEDSIIGVKGEDRPWKVIGAVGSDWGLCPKRQRPALLCRLTPGQRAFLFVTSLDGQIQGDGFYLYLWNSGDEVPGALEALQVIGAKDYVPIFQAAIGLFKSQAVLKNTRLRRAALEKRKKTDIDKLLQDPFDNLNENKETKLRGSMLAYLEKHPDEFFSSLKEVAAIEAAKTIPRDYRVSLKKVEKLRGEELHLALLEDIWDDYCEAFKPGEIVGVEKSETFLATLTTGQRVLTAARRLFNVVNILGWRDVLMRAAVNTPALQTLREVRGRPAVAERLDCACL